MGSTRLPGKALKDLSGQPMLERVINRSKRAKFLDAVVVATTVKPTDDAIVDLCGTHDWAYFRGSEEDVLDRYYQAALAFKADVIVRITSDCPLIEPEIVDKVIGEFLVQYPDVDYASNNIVRTYPHGLDLQVFSLKTLETAWHEDSSPLGREHVVPYMWHHPEKFRCIDVTDDQDHSHMRWTVDTIEDFTFVSKIYDHFKHDEFTWKEVLRLLENNPEWVEINRNTGE